MFTILKCIICTILKPMINNNCIWLNLSFILFTMKLNMVKKHDSVQIGVFKGSRDIYTVFHNRLTLFLCPSSSQTLVSFPSNMGFVGLFNLLIYAIRIMTLKIYNNNLYTLIYSIAYNTSTQLIQLIRQFLHSFILIAFCFRLKNNLYHDSSVEIIGVSGLKLLF